MRIAQFYSGAFAVVVRARERTLSARASERSSVCEKIAGAVRRFGRYSWFVQEHATTPSRGPRRRGTMRMKAALWYLLAGLEVWLGVCAILMGFYVILTAMTAVEPASRLELLAAVAAITLGAGLIADAFRRELGERVLKNLERFGNPLDSPTRPGQA